MRRFAVGLLMAGLMPVSAQVSEQVDSIGLPNDAEPVPTPTPSLFVPVVPGRFTPPPIAPGPLEPAAPPAAGAPRSPVFLPADIPAPGIQATPNTSDIFPDDAALLGEPTPTPAPARRVAETRPAAPARPTSVPVTSEQPALVSQAQLSSMVTQATERQDAALAVKAGWGYFGRNEFSSAGLWFNQALEWNPGLGEAAYGLALSKFREGDLSSAEAIVNFRGDSYPKMRVLKGDIASRRAVEAYEAKNYARSRDLMLQASRARPLSRNEQIILAWDYYYTKDYANAADLFEKLYRASPNENTAQGLYASLAKTQNYDRVESIGSQVKGPLNRIGGSSEARRYFNANLFVASAAVGGEKIYPVLENYTTPSIAAGFGFAAKSGTEGEGKLNTGIVPIISGRIYPTNKTILTAQVSRITLNSGDLAPGAVVGQYPEEFQEYSVTPQTSYNNLFDFSVRFEYQDWISWYATFGITPSGGPLNAKPIGNIGMLYRTEQGYFQAELYSKAIKESILSYIGMEDPYTGKDWGGVTEQGVSLQFFRSIAPRWTIFLKGTYGILDGTDVKENTHLSGTAAIAYEFSAKNFEYITLGLAVSYETFDNNQNHFTYGHGGYFSPEYVAQALIQAQFLTQEGRRWIAAGSLGLGVQNNRQAAAPYFPLDPDGRNYPSSESSTAIGLIAAQGGYLISPQWLVGGELGYAVTADYNEGFISVYVRYFFEERNGLLRTDLGLDRP
ncbi:MAG: cellulose synthase subunit BcsC-related outer membrane protein [Terrimicrobiaceae bacterium]|nr:cellulose synthase subunit BcsC-related outer membrane protein [Terrimicrobiaceae bacterium]